MMDGELPEPPVSSGRPTAFKDEYIRQAEHLCRLGATDEDLAAFFQVTSRTIIRWRSANEAFCQATKIGKDAADDRVERSLYHKAVGYTFESEKIFQHQGEVIRAETKEHVPPDTVAAIFWLKNRRRETWKDVKREEHTGADGGPIEITSEADAFARRISSAAARAATTSRAEQSE